MRCVQACCYVGYRGLWCPCAWLGAWLGVWFCVLGQKGDFARKCLYKGFSGVIFAFGM